MSDEVAVITNEQYHYLVNVEHVIQEQKQDIQTLIEIAESERKEVLDEGGYSYATDSVLKTIQRLREKYHG